VTSGIGDLGIAHVVSGITCHLDSFGRAVRTGVDSIPAPLSARSSLNDTGRSTGRYRVNRKSPHEILSQTVRSEIRFLSDIQFKSAQIVLLSVRLACVFRGFFWLKLTLFKLCSSSHFSGAFHITCPSHNFISHFPILSSASVFKPHVTVPISSSNAQGIFRSHVTNLPSGLGRMKPSSKLPLFEIQSSSTLYAVECHISL
jgi:hypothetical protein